LIVQCVNKMSILPDSDKMKVRDAASLCLTGAAIKDRI
jgi:hypothetical protein